MKILQLTLASDESPIYIFADHIVSFCSDSGYTNITLTNNGVLVMQSPDKILEMLMQVPTIQAYLPRNPN